MNLGDKLKNICGIDESSKGQLRPMLSYTCANITLGGAGYPLSQFNQQFLSYVEGMPVDKAGQISLFTGLWDAISNPIMGFVTDRTRSKMGRHRPYLLYGAIPFAIAYFLRWTSFGLSSTGNDQKVWWWYLFTGLLYCTFMTMMSIPHTAMLPTIAPEYFIRTQYKIIEYGMNSIGQVTSYIFTALALSGFNIVTALGKLPNPSPADRPKYALVGLVLMFWFSWSPILSFFKTKEPSSVGQQNEPFDFKYVLHEYKSVFSNRSFRQYFWISLFFTMSRYFYGYADQYFMISVTDTYKFFISLNMISGLAEFLGSPVNYFLVRFKGKTSCGKILGPMMVLGLVMNAFLSFTTPKWIKYSVIVLSSVLYNFGFSGPGFVADNIQPDVTDVDELMTGRRREGVISTFTTLFQKTISSLMGFAVGESLKAFGYNTRVPQPQKQSELTNFGLRLNYAIIPSVLALFCVWSIFRYTMTKSDHEVIQELIREKHEKGFCEIAEDEKKRIERIAGKKWDKMWIGQPSPVPIGE